jgi:hypothetical protein
MPDAPPVIATIPGCAASRRTTQSGPYVLVRSLGRGGFARVFQAASEVGT